MQASQSIIQSPRESWASRLHAAAEKGALPIDRQALLDQFRAHSSFYRERLAGVTDWAGVPALERDQVGRVPVLDDGTLKEARTSGTTGEQVAIWNTSREREFRRALLYRPQLFYGLPARVRQVIFVDGDWCMTADDWPKRYSYGGVDYQSWFAGAAADVESIRRLLLAVRPQLVRGISSALVRFLVEAGQGFQDLGVAIVGPSCEFLLPEWRSLIAEGFNARVLDRYGSQETGAIAWQCPHCDAYHANADEILLESGPDGLLATPLFITSQPFLRYRLNDQVRIDAGSGDCPVRLPTLTIQAARRDDWVVDGAGRRISPLGFQFERLEGLQAWRLHQSADGGLCLYFDAQPGAAAEPALGQALLAALSRQVPGRPIELVEGVWRLKRAGKFKRIVSDFPSG